MWLLLRLELIHLNGEHLINFVSSHRSVGLMLPKIDIFELLFQGSIFLIEQFPLSVNGI